MTARTIRQRVPAYEVTEGAGVTHAKIEQAMADYRDGKLVQTRAAMRGH